MALAHGAENSDCPPGVLAVLPPDMTTGGDRSTDRGMRNDENPSEPDRPLSPDVPAPPSRDFDAGTTDVPEPPNKDEVRPDDDVNPEAGSTEPPD